MSKVRLTASTTKPPVPTNAKGRKKRSSERNQKKNLPQNLWKKLSKIYLENSSLSILIDGWEKNTEGRKTGFDNDKGGGETYPLSGTSRLLAGAHSAPSSHEHNETRSKKDEN